MKKAVIKTKPNPSPTALPIPPTPSVVATTRTVARIRLRTKNPDPIFFKLEVAPVVLRIVGPTAVQMIASARVPHSAAITTFGDFLAAKKPML